MNKEQRESREKDTELATTIYNELNTLGASSVYTTYFPSDIIRMIKNTIQRGKKTKRQYSANPVNINEGRWLFKMIGYTNTKSVSVPKITGKMTFEKSLREFVGSFKLNGRIFSEMIKLKESTYKVRLASGNWDKQDYVNMCIAMKKIGDIFIMFSEQASIEATSKTYDDNSEENDKKMASLHGAIEKIRESISLEEEGELPTIDGFSLE